jgi:hypothetical protein
MSLLCSLHAPVSCGALVVVDAVHESAAVPPRRRLRLQHLFPCYECIDAEQLRSALRVSHFWAVC